MPKHRISGGKISAESIDIEHGHSDDDNDNDDQIAFIIVQEHVQKMMV